MRPGLYAFAVAAAFLGATFYIGVVEQPARLKLGGRAMLKEWTFSFRRGTAHAVRPRGRVRSPRFHSIQT